MNTFNVFYRNERYQVAEEGILKNTLASLGVVGSLLTSPVRGGTPDQPTPVVSAVNTEVQQGFNLAYYFIKSQENSKFNKHGGWDNKLQKWLPHKSVEGGTDTLGYGHKFSSKTEAQEYKDGISDEDAGRLLYTDLVEKYKAVAKKLQQQGYKLPTNKYAIAMLLDIEFNTTRGITGYPKFIKALMTNDVPGMLSNYHRYVMIKGSPVELGRSKAFKSALLEPYIASVTKAI